MSGVTGKSRQHPSCKLQLEEDRKNKGTYSYKSYRFEVLFRETNWTIMYFQYMP